MGKKKIGEKKDVMYGAATGSGYERVDGGWKLSPTVVDRLGVADEQAVNSILEGVVDPLYDILRRIHARRNSTMSAVRRDLNIRSTQKIVIDNEGVLRLVSEGEK